MLKLSAIVLALITSATLGCSNATTSSPEPEAISTTSTVQGQSTATPVPVPTSTVVPTQTPIPTPIPVPTSTQEPTATQVPTATPQPTDTPIPSATHSPTAIPTSTQVPTATTEPSPTSSPTAMPEPTATPTASPSPSPTPAPTGPAKVEITRIFFDGEEPRYEGDEYVEITNLGGEPQQMEGWVLKDVEDKILTFVFPAYILEPGGIIRVYTDEIHPEWGGFSFERGTAIWNNSDPDTAELTNANGNQVSVSSYRVKRLGY